MDTNHRTLMKFWQGLNQERKERIFYQVLFWLVFLTLIIGFIIGYLTGSWFFIKG